MSLTLICADFRHTEKLHKELRIINHVFFPYKAK